MKGQAVRSAVGFLMAMVFGSALTYANEQSSGAVARYLSYVGAIREIKYRAIACTDESERYPAYVPRLDGLVVNSKVDVRWNLVTNDYYHRIEQFPMDTPPADGYLESSLVGEMGIHGTIMEGYMSDESSGLGKSDAGLGSIGPIKDHFESRGPELMMGFGVSRLVAKQRINLSEMLDSRELEHLPEESLLVRNCMKWQGVPVVIDCKVSFSKEHRYLPQQITFISRVLSGGDSVPLVAADVLEWGTTEEGEPFPARFRAEWFSHSSTKSEPYICIVEDSSLRLNPRFADSDFTVTFPSAKRVFNVFTDQVLVNGVVVEDYSKPRGPNGKSKTQSFSSLWIYIGVLTLLVLALVVWRVRARSSTYGALVIVPMFMLEGCGRPEANEWASFNEYVAVSPRTTTVLIDLDSKPGANGFEFKLRNKAKTPIQIEDIVTSCGCTRASCDTKTIAPLASTTIRGSISRDPTSSKKLIGLNVRCNVDDLVFDLPLQVHVEFKAKWMPVLPSVLLVGGHDEEVPIQFEVHTTDKHVLNELIAFLYIDGQRTSMHRRVFAEGGRIEFHSRCKLPSDIGTEPMGDILVQVAGEEETRSFPVIAQTRSQAEWSPRAIVLEPEQPFQDVVLRLGGGAQWMRIECDDAITAELQSDSTPQRKTVRVRRSHSVGGTFRISAIYNVDDREFSHDCLVEVPHEIP